jgi:hypothetical protein
MASAIALLFQQLGLKYVYMKATEGATFKDSIMETFYIESVIKNMPFWEANYNNDPWNLPVNFF